MLRLLSLFILFVVPTYALASEEHAPELPEHEWTFDGMFGTYDKASLQRGLQVYRQVCSACHSLKRVRFRDLEALGYDESQIKAIAAEYTIEDGPNDEGEMYERARLPSDAFPDPYPNKQAGKVANGGALPPDLSLMAKARHDGANYIAALINGYEEAPHGKELMEGQYWNTYMPGHVIAMPPQLSDDLIAYSDGSPTTAEQYSEDIAHFLMWAADPYMEDRKRTGIKVLLFLLVFAGLMYAYKKRIWADVH